MNNNTFIWDFNECSSKIVIVQFKTCLRTFILYVDTKYITDQIEKVHYDRPLSIVYKKIRNDWKITFYIYDKNDNYI